MTQMNEQFYKKIIKICQLSEGSPSDNLIAELFSCRPFVRLYFSAIPSKSSD